MLWQIQRECCIVYTDHIFCVCATTLSFVKVTATVIVTIKSICWLKKSTYVGVNSRNYTSSFLKLKYLILFTDNYYVGTVIWILVTIGQNYTEGCKSFLCRSIFSVSKGYYLLTLLTSLTKYDLRCNHYLQPYAFRDLSSSKSHIIYT